MKRSTTSASNIFRRAACPGSAFAEDHLPDSESTDAMEGTLLHALNVDPEMDRSMLTREQKEILATSAKGDDDIFKAIELSIKITEAEEFEEGFEQELWLRRGIKAIFPGHCDRWRYYPGRKILIIIDQKFGRNEVVPAESNLQLRSYAVMADREWDCAGGIVVAINQPRLPKADRLTIAEYTAKDLPAAKEHLLSIWNGAHNPDGTPREDAPRKAGLDHCRYCKAKEICETYTATYAALGEVSAKGKDSYVATLAEMTDERLDFGWKAVSFAAIIRDSLKKELLRRIEAGGMANYETKATGKMTKITDPVEAWAILKREAGFTEDELKACITIPMTPLVEKLCERDDMKEVDAKKLLRNVLGDVLKITEKDPSLSRLKDGETRSLPDNGSDDALFPK